MSSAASPAKVELRNVKKRFGSKVVLDGLNLTIPKGQSLVVIGGSGTGKSVMIKCVLGILRPDAGEIYVDGEEVTGLRGSARYVLRPRAALKASNPRARSALRSSTFSSPIWSLKVGPPGAHLVAVR